VKFKRWGWISGGVSRKALEGVGEQIPATLGASQWHVGHQIVR